MGWGSWGASNKWDSKGADTTSTNVTDTNTTNDTNPTTFSSSEGNSWSFSGNKKNKKKTTTSAFDFTDFGMTEEANEETINLDLDEGSKGAADDNDWNTFSPVNKKDKNKKKKGVDEDTAKDVKPVVEDDSTMASTQDTWGIWGTGKKDKKGKVNEVTSVPPPPPAAPAPPAPEEEWGFGNKKDKKKGKKAGAGTGAGESPVVEEPVAVAATQVQEEGMEGLGAFPVKKDKKKTKKNQAEEAPSSAAGSVPESDFLADEWASFSTKKERKQSDAWTLEEAQNPAVTEVPEKSESAGDTWSMWGSTTKNNKKSKTAGITEIKETPAISAIPNTDVTSDNTWGTSGSLPKKDKKNKNRGLMEINEEPTLDAGTVGLTESISAAPEESWTPSWGNVKKKEKKGDKSKKSALPETDTTESGLPPVIELDITAEEHTAVPSNDWFGGLEAGKKKGKGAKKGGVLEENQTTPVPPPPPSPPAPEINAFDFFENTQDDTWNNWKIDKGREDVKDVWADSSLAAVDVPQVPIEGKLNSDDEFKKSIAKLPQRERKKKEKEREKEKAKREKEKEMEREREEIEQKEREEREQQEREDEERKEREEREEKEREEREEKEKEKGKDQKKKISRKGVAAPVEETKSKDLFAGLVTDDVQQTDGRGNWGTAKTDGKKKGGQKGFSFGFDAPPPAPTPPAQGLSPEPTPEPEAQLDDLAENSWGSFVPTKAKNKTKKDVVGRTTPMSKVTEVKEGKTATLNKSIDLLSTLNESSQDHEPSSILKDETPAKAVRSFGGGGFGSAATTTATATATAKNSKDKEEKAKAEANKAADLDLIDIIDEGPVKKGTKAKAGGKLTKWNSKESDKAAIMIDKMDDFGGLIDVVDEAPPEPSKGTDTKAKVSEKNDAWGFWGSSKKPGGKKGDEATKEINKTSTTNEMAAKISLTEWSNEPEPTTPANPADQAAQPAKTSKLTSTTKMPITKSSPLPATATKTLSVGEKIKAFEKEKLKKAESKVVAAAPPPLPPAPEPLPQTDLPPRKANALPKSKATSKVTVANKKKDPSPPPKEDQQILNDYVPGSFPAEFIDDDDILDLTDLPPVEKKESMKSAKSVKAQKEITMESFMVEAPAPPAPPTPPPEPVAPKASAKKERARIIRDQGASSWGFWGAAPKQEPKKERKPKDDVDVTTSPSSKGNAVAPGLNRSKSTKTPREKAKEELSKSSGSDKDKKVQARPAKSRGSSFSGFFGGPPPVRTKSIRRTSTAIPKTGSRRQSIDEGAPSMPSPPPDDLLDISNKAARTLGAGAGKLGRRESVRGKQTASGKKANQSDKIKAVLIQSSFAAVPDPYPIDDDDMVMVNGLEDPVINAPLPPKEPKKDVRREKISRTKSKKEVGADFVYPQNENIVLPERIRSSEPSKGQKLSANQTSKYEQDQYIPDPADDIVMVEAGPFTDGPDVVTGPDDIAFVEKPREAPPLKRSSTTSKKSGGGIGGLFGFRKPRRTSDALDLPKSNGTYVADDGTSRRKRTVTADDEATKRFRRDDRKIRRTDRNERDAKGFAASAPPYTKRSAEADEAEARRAERRARKEDQVREEARTANQRKTQEQEARDLLKATAEERKAKIRELREQKARENEQKEFSRQDDPHISQVDNFADGGQAAREFDDPPTERYPKRRERDREEPRERADTTSRPHRSDRRRSHLDKPISSRSATEEADRRARREERRSRRATPNEKPTSSRRKTEPPVDDYFDPRNGGPVEAEPYPNPISGATDHTSGWVNSQIIEPPSPPPIEPTVIEPPPILGETSTGARDLDDEEDLRRAKRKASRRRSSRYVDAVGGADDAEEKRRRRERREREIRSSEGSGEGDRYREGRRRGDYTDRERERGSRPVPNKRESWFKKITSL